MNAIKMHINDLDESRVKGSLLREIIRNNWILEGENLKSFSKIWTN